MATTRNADDLTIERWRTEPKLVGLKFSEPLSAPDAAPPLWSDLTIASAVAVLLWGAAVVVFG